jgi:hypothetical protein
VDLWLHLSAIKQAPNGYVCYLCWKAGPYFNQRLAANEWMGDYHSAPPTADLITLQAREEELDKAENAWTGVEKSFDEICLWGHVLSSESSLL